MTLRWRRSSFSGDTDCVELAWLKSSFSGDTNCVELAIAGAVRDSKNPGGPVLAAELRVLLAAIKNWEAQ